MSHFVMAHREKGVFIGWAFGPGIAVWSSELHLLRRLPDNLKAPTAPDKTAFTVPDNGWQTGFLFNRPDLFDPADLCVIEVAAEVVDRPLSESLPDLLQLVQEHFQQESIS